MESKIFTRGARYLFGDWTLLSTLLYMSGILLLVIEGLIPGFGIFGISGVIFVFISVYLITTSLLEALLLLLVTIALMSLAIVIMYKLGIGSKYMKFLVLKTEQKNEEGYVSTKDYKKYLGKRAKAESTLRPSGTIIIDDLRIDAVTQGEYVDKGSFVEVIKVEGSSLIVKKINEEDL